MVVIKIKTKSADNTTTRKDEAMNIEGIKFEMTRANSLHDSCVRLGLAESADLYKADYVRLQNKLDEITTMTKECDWCGRDIRRQMLDSDGDAKLRFVGRGRTFECCSTKCMIEAARRQFYGS